MDAGVTIRRIRSDEGPAFRAIRLRAIAESPLAFGSTLPETETRPAAYWDGRARSGAEGIENILLVAEAEQRWVGIVGGFLEGAGRRVDIVSMWVDPACRGRGAGRDLIEAVLAWAREHQMERAVLWVTESNGPAIALYRRAGFIETGARQPLPSHPHILEMEMVRDLSV